MGLRRVRAVERACGRGEAGLTMETIAKPGPESGLAPRVGGQRMVKREELERMSLEELLCYVLAGDGSRR
jgi:hypothetical protein